MAIAFDAAIDVAGSSVSSVTSANMTVAGSDRCLVGSMVWADAFVADYNWSAFKWGGSGGTSLTEFGSASFYSFWGIVTGRLIAPSASTTTLYGAITGTVTRLCIGAANYTGVDQTTPLGTAANASGQSNAPSVSVTLGTDEWALGWLNTEGDTCTPGGSQNQRWEDENASLAASGDDRTGSGSVAVSWSTPGVYDRWVARGVNLKPAAAASASLLPGFTPMAHLLVR